MSQSIQTLVTLLSPLAASLTVSENGDHVSFVPDPQVVSKIVGRTVDQIIREVAANGGTFQIYVSNGEVAFISVNYEAIAHPDTYQGVILAIGALLDDLAATEDSSVFTTGQTITETAEERGEAV